MSTDNAMTMTPTTAPTQRPGYKHPRGTLKSDLAIQKHELMRENLALRNELAAAKQQQQQAEDFAAVERKEVEVARRHIVERDELLAIANHTCATLNERVRSLEAAQCWFCKARAWWGKGATA